MFLPTEPLELWHLNKGWMAFIHRQSPTHRLDLLRLIFYSVYFYFVCVCVSFLSHFYFYRFSTLTFHLRFNLGQTSIYHGMSVCKPSLFNLQLLSYFAHMNLSSPSYHFKITIHPFTIPLYIHAHIANLFQYCCSKHLAV